MAYHFRLSTISVRVLTAEPTQFKVNRQKTSQKDLLPKPRMLGSCLYVEIEIWGSNHEDVTSRYIWSPIHRSNQKFCRVLLFLFIFHNWKELTTKKEDFICQLAKGNKLPPSSCILFCKWHTIFQLHVFLEKIAAIVWTWPKTHEMLDQALENCITLEFSRTSLVC